MLTSLIEYISVQLNRHSREHRYVGYVLSKERQKLKESKGEVRKRETMTASDENYRI